MSGGDTILAIDLGTSGPKVALITVAGEVLASTNSSTSLLLPPGGGAEQDPEDWWRAILEATHALLSGPDKLAQRVAAISVTGQWSGTVPVDERGRALGNAILWMDTRGASDVRALCKGWPSIDGYGVRKAMGWVRKTGGAPSLNGKDPVGHILWLKRCDPERFAQARWLLEPTDYLNLRLTGTAAASYDSIALHWVTDNRNIDAIDYDDGLLRLTGLPKDKLPPLRRATDVMGELSRSAAAELGLPAGVPVVCGTPDVQSAALGSGAIGPAKAHLYLGTSSWISTHVGFKKTDLLRNIASLPSALPGQYFVANEQETAGACMNWLRDGVMFGSDAIGDDTPPTDALARIDAAAQSVPPGSDGLLFTPWLIGERCPVADEHVRGSFLNLSLSTTRAHLARAVLEGVAYNTRWLLSAFERFVGTRVPSLRVVGGGAKSAVWCQIHADILGRTIEQLSDPLMVNARGAAAVGALGIGAITPEDLAERRVPVERTFEPRESYRERYDAQFAAFLDHYKQSKGMFRRLNG